MSEKRNLVTFIDNMSIVKKKTSGPGNTCLYDVPSLFWSMEHVTKIPGCAKRTHVFQIIVTLFIFNIKKITSTPKEPVINAVLIT